MGTAGEVGSGSRPGGQRHRGAVVWGSRSRRWKSTVAVIAVGSLATTTMALVSLTGSAQAASTTTTLTPTGLTTTAGGTGGQRVSALGTRDSSGSSDTWKRYVELGGDLAGEAYSGYAEYTLPASVPAASMTGITVKANYRGPSAGEQKWTWSLYNWSSRTWAPVGTNAAATSWSSWKLLSFKASGELASDASAAGTIRVRITSSNAADNADLDYLAVVVTSSSSGSPTATTPPATTPTAPATTTAPPTTTPPATTTAPTTAPPTQVTTAPTASATTTAPKSDYALPPANAVWDYQIGGPYTPIAQVGIVDRDHAESPAAGKYNVCYVNGFQTQPGDSGQWPSAALLRDSAGKLVEDKDWPGEYMVDTRSETSRTAIMSVVGSWIDSCATKGFDAVEVDNLDTFTRDPSKQLTQAGNLALAKLMATRAHSQGLAIAQKNTVELASAGKTQVGFDFAVVESCQLYDECSAYTDVYGAQVYEVEYYEEGGEANWQAACDARGASISITYRDVMVTPFGESGYKFKYC